MVMDHIETQFATSSKVGIVYMYCDYQDQKIQTLIEVLGSISQQLLAALPESSVDVLKALEPLKDHNRKKMTLEVKDILSLLEVIERSFDRVFICVDALDELEEKTRIELLKVLKNNLTTAQLFITGRPHIEAEVERYVDHQEQVMVKIEASLEDIQSYIEHEIELDNNPDAMTMPLKEEIKTSIAEQSHGM